MSSLPSHLESLALLESLSGLSGQLAQTVLLHLEGPAIPVDLECLSGPAGQLVPLLQWLQSLLVYPELLVDLVFPEFPADLECLLALSAQSLQSRLEVQLAPLAQSLPALLEVPVHLAVLENP